MCKKNILIVDLLNKRNNNTKALYENFKKNNKFNFLFYENINGDLITAKKTLNVCDIDLIFFGANSLSGSFAENSIEKIKKEKIQCVLLTTDNEELDKNNLSYVKNTKFFFDNNLICKLITACLPSNSINNFCEQNNFKNVVCIPNGINSEYKNCNKDIDVSFICSAVEGWHYHEQRIRIKEMLKNLPSSVTVFTDAVWGEDYEKILLRSKIFIVEGSMRKAMTQKYLEGAISKALLLGDRPETPQISFELFNEQTMEVLEDWNFLNNRLLYVLDNYKDFIYKIEKCYNMVRDNFDIKILAEKYKNLFEEIINNNK